VRVVLLGGQPSLEFAAFVYEQDRAGHSLEMVPNRLADDKNPIGFGLLDGTQ